VRVDTHAYAGYMVPPFYDSLIGKLIVYGNDRQEALVRTRIALESFVIEGVHTTIPFLLELLHDPDVVAGRLDTKLIERRMSERAAAAASAA
jgi:acetyl-CoA carboxylase, biotin carboxylase subunit